MCAKTVPIVKPAARRSASRPVKIRLAALAPKLQTSFTTIVIIRAFKNNQCFSPGTSGAEKKRTTNNHPAERYRSGCEIGFNF
jgi:hypothetical protein